MLRAVAAVSLVYDLGVGLTLFFFRELLQIWFGVPAAQPPIHVDLNAIFVIGGRCSGTCCRSGPGPLSRVSVDFRRGTEERRGRGVRAGLRAARARPRRFCCLPLSDGTLAALTLAALMRSHPRNEELRTKSSRSSFS